MYWLLGLKYCLRSSQSIRNQYINGSMIRIWHRKLVAFGFNLTFKTISCNGSGYNLYNKSKVLFDYNYHIKVFI